jgi:hypothetical protein
MVSSSSRPILLIFLLIVYRRTTSTDYSHHAFEAQRTIYYILETQKYIEGEPRGQKVVLVYA